MTEKCYLEDAYRVSFPANVLSCEALPSGRFAATLEKTYFYPESGGQPSDRGRIGDAEVVDVRENDAGVIIHEVTAPVERGEVQCEVDWQRRFDHMQHHTGQHLLTRAFIETVDMPTVSFHMGEEACTIDLEGGKLDEKVLVRAEDLSNAVIWEDREVLIRTVPLSELEEGALRRSLPPGVSEVRLVEIQGFDVVACCGTHVKRVGEIGAIKVLKYEKVRDSYRIHFKAGRWALRDHQEKHDLVKVLANRFTTSIEGISERVEKLAGEAQRARRDLQKLYKRLAGFEKDRILATARDHGGKRLVVHLCEEDEEAYLNLLASACKSEASTVAIIGSPRGVVFCTASPDLTVDIAERVAQTAKQAGGKGGGKGGFARVSLPSDADVRGFLEKLYEDVKKAL